ncbi:MAG: hypothetical protein WC242_03895 [Candidatus Paceibacterota bacterium]
MKNKKKGDGIFSPWRTYGTALASRHGALPSPCQVTLTSIFAWHNFILY